MSKGTEKETLDAVLSPAASSYPELSRLPGSDWLKWFGVAAQSMPEFGRALKFLDTAYKALGLSDNALPAQATEAERAVVQALNRFVGHARCPSASSCEKLAVRCHVLRGLLLALVDASNAQPQATPRQEIVFRMVSLGLQKLFVIGEGADDRAGVLVRALRGLTREWLRCVGEHVLDLQQKASLIFPVAMADQSGLVDQDWWWRALLDCDRQTVLALVEKEISNLVLMQPSTAVSWRSYDKRWRRSRLKGLLEFLNEPFLLSELLCRSAVDDFEAVQAIVALRQAGRHREAVKQAEEWQRQLPRSPVLAEQLFRLYVEDGWDDEALALVQSQYACDPHVRWIECLGQLNTPAAARQVLVWRKQAQAAGGQA